MIDYITQKTKNVLFYLRIVCKNPLRSLHILLYSLGMLTKPKSIVIKTFWGADMKIVIPEVVSSFLYLNNHFEVEVEQALLQYLHKGDVFVDIGAHIGTFSLLAAHIVGIKGHVYAFEPTPSTYKILEENLSEYSMSTALNKAVFSKDTSMDFHDFGVSRSALNSLYSPRTTENIKAANIKIKTVSLDNYFKNKPVLPSFIKIDAESAEYEILRGMAKILKKTKPIICIERPVLRIKGVVSDKQLFTLLTNNGYKPYQFLNGKFELCDPYKIRLYNILFLPKNYNPRQ